MKNKLIVSLLTLLTLLFVTTGTSFASSLSIRLQQPMSQTGNSNFSMTFVALDIQGRPISVQCYKQGPADAAMVAFGPVITLSAGGNTDQCLVGQGEVNQSGHTYQFEAVATAGLDTATSNIVSINYNNEGPGTPTNYSKSEDSCVYKIIFRTADDQGKTVKVVLYRSTDQNFDLNGSTQVNSVNIGSNTDSQIYDNVSPNCNTTYYYALRAFDAYGNASGAVGDSSSNQTVTTNTNVTGTPTQGAIPVTAGLTGATKQVLGQATQSAKPTPTVAKSNPFSSSVNWVLTHKKISLLVLIILLGVGYYLYRQQKKK